MTEFEDEVILLLKEILAILRKTNKMNNEPVAWFEQDENMKSIWYQCDKGSPNAIPLYTHPANLTDEEIEQIGKEYGIKSVYQFAYYEFAKAILRKAQEK